MTAILDEIDAALGEGRGVYVQLLGRGSEGRGPSSDAGWSATAARETTP